MNISTHMLVILTVPFIWTANSYSQVGDVKISPKYKMKVSYEFCRNYALITDDCKIEIDDKSGKKVADIEHVLAGHYHPVEIREDNIFWLSGFGDTQKDKGKEVQLWVQNLVSYSTEKLGSTSEFRASPDGRSVAYIKDNDIFLMIVKTKAVIKIASHGDGDSQEGFDLIAWSSDNKKFWFGSAANSPEKWAKLALFENEKVTWFPFSGSYEGFLEPDRGWLVSTDNIWFGDADDEAKFSRSKKVTHLKIKNVFSGKTIEIATSTASYFKPIWADNYLTYLLNGKSMKMSANEIKNKLK